MKNWKLNYYKTLEKFVKLKIKELESEGHVCDENPLEVFLSHNKKHLNLSKTKGSFRFNTDLNFDSGYLKFDNLLCHVGRKVSSLILEEKPNVIKSYMYGYRQPKSNNIKDYIKKTNGSLIFESFLNEIDDKSFTNKI